MVPSSNTFTQSFSGDLASDITILSSLLHTQVDFLRKSIPRDKNNPALNLVTHIATLLSATDNGSMSNAHAVMGAVDDSVLHCLVFTDNRQLSSQFNEEDPTSFVPLKPNKENGRVLLRSVKNRKLDSAGHESDSTAHVRDVFDIISFLQTDEREDSDLIRFLCFVYTRSYGALRNRILDLPRHWLGNPFLIMHNNIRAFTTRIGLTKHFHINLGRLQLSILQKFGLMEESPLFPIHDHNHCIKLMVNLDNVPSWQSLFLALWQVLEAKCSEQYADCKQVDNPLWEAIAFNFSDISSSYSYSRMRLICFLIGTMYALKPILKHLLSDHDGNSNLNLLLRNVTVKERPDVWSKPDEITPEFERPLVGEAPEYDEEYNETASDRLFRTLERIMAWHSAAVYVWKQAPRFLNGKKLQVFQYSYDSPSAKNITAAQILAVLRGIRRTDIWTRDDIEAIRKRTLLASIHAEAALMFWASKSKQGRDLVCKSQMVLVGASKKCCRLCGLLKETLNNEQDSTPTILLPGMHTTFFPWISPPGTPEPILVTLRHKLLQAARCLSLDSDGRLDESEESDDDEPVPFFFYSLAEVLG